MEFEKSSFFSELCKNYKANKKRTGLHGKGETCNLTDELS